MKTEPTFVVTIGRQFGSGGRELGQLIAERLGIGYYDKELLCQAAAHAGVATEVLERNDEKFPKYLGGVFAFNLGMGLNSLYAGNTAVNGDSVYAALSGFIRRLASERSCVIVGRSADYVLRDHPQCVNIFIHSSIDDRIRRIMSRGDTPTAGQARALAEKTNKLRANFYNFYTDKTWGAAESYDMTFNSSVIPVSEIADIVAGYCRRHFIS